MNTRYLTKANGSVYAAAVWMTAYMSAQRGVRDDLESLAEVTMAAIRADER